MMIGKSLSGRYFIISQLGRGGFGETFLAEDRQLPGHPKCVVKQLKPATTDEGSLETARRLFQTEAEVLYKLGGHDRIPQLFAHFEEEQEFFLVQEFIEGQSLKEEFEQKQQCLDETETIELLKDILEILVFVHSHKVIHRDLKPANLIRRQKDQKLVLIDFGAVKQINTLNVNEQGETTSTIAIGSPGYMPSEQTAGNPRFSSDIYAVGIIGIVALTGFSPRQFTTNSKTGEINWKNDVKISKGLEYVLDKMVRYDFRQRYQKAAAVLADLKNLDVYKSSIINVSSTSQKAASSKLVNDGHTVTNNQKVNSRSITDAHTVTKSVVSSKQSEATQTVRSTTQKQNTGKTTQFKTRSKPSTKIDQKPRKLSAAQSLQEKLNCLHCESLKYQKILPKIQSKWAVIIPTFLLLIISWQMYHFSQIQALLNQQINVAKSPSPSPSPSPLLSPATPNHLPENVTPVVSNILPEVTPSPILENSPIPTPINNAPEPTENQGELVPNSSPIIATPITPIPMNPHDLSRLMTTSQIGGGAEAMGTIETIQKMQIVYYLTNNNFTNNWDELGLNMPQQTANYNYQITQANQRFAVITAKATKADLKNYTGIIFADGKQKICESNQPARLIGQKLRC